ncbi:MAG: hypothetical protein JXB03_02565 [Spirochaetales bacterium]|nr:hypothetical protein [Spirochaetales bacterium]
MVQRFSYYLLLVLSAVGFLSCTNGAISGSAIDSGVVDIVTVQQGIILSEGQKVPMTLMFNPDMVRPSEIEVELKMASGEVIDSVIIPYSDNLVPFELSRLENGTYVLNLVVRESDNTIIGSDEVTFFFTADAYSIRQVTSYPTMIEPDSDVLLFAEYEYPEGSDPYIRWSYEDEVIASGPFSLQGNALQWHVPDKAGVYTLTAELFPFAPLDGEFMFTAPVSMRGSVFTANSIEPGIAELSPEEFYDHLYHFRGNFRNYGINNNTQVTIIGEPELEVRDGMLGYRFNGESGLTWNANLLSGEGENEEDYDVLLQLKGIFDQVDETVHLMSIGDDIRLTQHSDNLMLSLFSETVELPFLSDYDFIGLRLSLVGDTGFIEWYDEGEPRLRQELPASVIDQVRSLEAETRFGFGMSMTLDEFGIIHPASSSNSVDQFNQAMYMRYGGDLLFSEGFDRSIEALDERLRLSGDMYIDVGSSSLVMADGAAVTIENIQVSLYGLQVIFEGEENRFSALFLEKSGEYSEIPFEYAQGYYYCRIFHENTHLTETQYIEQSPVNLIIHGPGTIKSIILLNGQNDIAEREGLPVKVTSRIASM